MDTENANGPGAARQYESFWGEVAGEPGLSVLQKNELFVNTSKVSKVAEVKSVAIQKFDSKVQCEPAGSK
jgi:hypothetical protein